VGALDERGIAPRRRAADDEPGTVDAESMEATLELCVALITALDEDLARREPNDTESADQATDRTEPAAHTDASSQDPAP
jgi:hypothetical protein